MYKKIIENKLYKFNFSGNNIYLNCNTNMFVYLNRYLIYVLMNIESKKFNDDINENIIEEISKDFLIKEENYSKPDIDKLYPVINNFEISISINKLYKLITPYIILEKRKIKINDLLTTNNHCI